jgi:hypothetical protein
MKKVLLTASLIGLFMAASMDLQARYRRNDQPQRGRSVISSSQSRHAPSRDRSNSYSQYGNRQGRNVRSGVSFGQSRHAPSRDRYNSYGRYTNHPGRYLRGGISLGLSMVAPMLDRYNSYGRYTNHPGRYIASEIRRNEERIWLLEERMDRLYSYGSNYGEIRELEQEINYLQRRNDFLRNRRY